MTSWYTHTHQIKIAFETQYTEHHSQFAKAASTLVKNFLPDDFSIFVMKFEYFIILFAKVGLLHYTNSNQKILMKFVKWFSKSSSTGFKK